MRLCFRAFDAVKLMTSGASPIAQMSGAVSKDLSSIAAKNIHVGGDGRGALLARPETVVLLNFARNQLTASLARDGQSNGRDARARGDNTSGWLSGSGRTAP
jgi:hypothetical protein